MSKKANPALIGAFVIVAIAIAFMGLMVLGSGRFFDDSETYVLHFPGDLSGLDAGAPVTLRGVRVGQVETVSIVYDSATGDITTPVMITISADSFTRINLSRKQEAVDAMAMHIDRGLRARLELQSVVTGKLRVSLDFFPDEKAVYRGHDDMIREIPTLAGALDTLATRISSLPLEEIILDMRESSKGVASLVNSGKVQEALDELNTTLGNISKLAGSPELQGAIASMDATLKETQTIMQNFTKNSGTVQRELLIAVEEFSDAARAAQQLLDYIERHPESLIRGKGKE